MGKQETPPPTRKSASVPSLRTLYVRDALPQNAKEAFQGGKVLAVALISGVTAMIPARTAYRLPVGAPGGYRPTGISLKTNVWAAD